MNDKDVNLSLSLHSSFAGLYRYEAALEVNGEVSVMIPLISVKRCEHKSPVVSSVATLNLISSAVNACSTYHERKLLLLRPSKRFKHPTTNGRTVKKWKKCSVWLGMGSIRTSPHVAIDLPLGYGTSLMGMKDH